MAIPSALIPALRVAFRSQGFPEATLRDDGTINPAGILAGMYDEIEFRTALTPTIKVNTRDLTLGGPTHPFVSFIKPTVVLRGKGEETVIAPLGATQGGGWLPGIAVAAGLVGIGYLLGKA
jgi:hypothetical protein